MHTLDNYLPHHHQQQQQQQTIITRLEGDSFATLLPRGTYQSYKQQIQHEWFRTLPLLEYALLPFVDALTPSGKKSHIVGMHITLIAVQKYAHLYATWIVQQQQARNDTVIYICGTGREMLISRLSRISDMIVMTRGDLPSITSSSSSTYPIADHGIGAFYIDFYILRQARCLVLSSMNDMFGLAAGLLLDQSNSVVYYPDGNQMREIDPYE